MSAPSRTAEASRAADFSIRSAFLLLLLVLGVGVWLNHRHVLSLYQAQRSVAHAQRVLSDMRGVLNSLVDAETAVRGFALTGAQDHMEPYRDAVPTLPRRVSALLALTRDNPQQSERVRALIGDLYACLAHLDRIVDARRSGGPEAAMRMVQSGDGKQLMDTARATISDFEASEASLLETRQVEAETSYDMAQTMGLVLGASGLFLVVVVYQMVRRLDRLRSESARESADARQRFEVSLGSIGDAVLMTDAEGRVTFCNEGCRSSLLIEDGDIGRQLEEIITSVDASTGQAGGCVVRQAHAEGGIHRTGPNAAVRRRDGSVIPVDATASRIRRYDGSTQGVVLVVRNVSEQRERERELARSNERFRSLVLATSQTVWTTDADGVVREDSPTWRLITGQTYAQWKGTGWLDALHPDDRERVAAGWRQAVADKRQYSVEYRLRTAQGAYRWNMVRAVPVVDSDGNVREWVGMNHDIQARKEAEEALRDTNRRKDEFIALLAHELRNPLAPLRHGLEVVRQGSAPDANRALEIMGRQLSHMVRLIDDLLDVSRISQGKLELRKESLDLRDVLSQVCDAALPSAAAKGQRLVVRLPSEPLWLSADAVRLAQTMSNLLSNAIKYSDAGASIWLSSEREGMNHVVTVRDTGHGIPADLLPRIWDMFLQGRTRAARESGLGIGLTLVKHLVEMHGGSVTVHSEGPGTGSEFVVRLPAGAPAADEAQSVPAPISVRPLRILVIDDNEDSADSLRMLLHAGQHEVRVASRGELGLEEHARFLPELVLCDIRMPDISGFDVARVIRAANSVQPAFLVALTGFGSAADREASLRAGFDDHLVKPVDTRDLRRMLEAAAARAAGA